MTSAGEPNSKFSIGDIAFGAAIAFLFGDLSASLGWGVMVTMIVTMAVTMIFATSFAMRLRSVIMVALAAMAVVFFGLFYHQFFVNARAAAFDVPLGKEISFRAIVTDEPDPSGNFLMITAEAQSPFAGEVTIFADPAAFFHYGDLIQARGIVEPARAADEDPALFPQSLSLIAPNHGFFLRAWMIDFKDAILQKFSDALPADEAALLGGMTLGGTAGMSALLKNQMSLSGTSYLAAMYGYKINILIFESVGLLGSWVTRRKRFFITLGLLALFVAMTGAEASAVRAAVMGAIAISARELGRMPSMRNAIAITAALMVLSDPTLVTQAGFLLSFLSLIGIVCLSAPLEKLFRWDDVQDHDNDRGNRNDFLHWKEAVIMSVASLLPIIPIIMVTFGQFPATAFLSNVLVFPAILPMMLFGCAVAATGFISYHLAFIVAKFAEILIWYELGVIRLFSVIVVPLPQIFAAGSPSWQFVLYYAALALFVYHYGRKGPSCPSSGRWPGPMLPILNQKSTDPYLHEDDDLNDF